MLRSVLEVECELHRGNRFNFWKYARQDAFGEPTGNLTKGTPGATGGIPGKYPRDTRGIPRETRG